MMKNKKGALVQNIIIGIVILIITAAILFYFLKIFPYEETINKEACHQSVILRSQEIAGLQPGQLAGIPLNCKTQHIEISSTDENFIKREIANQMYDCWWMLGEGEMDFFSESIWQSYAVPGAGYPKSACVICTTIKFDDNVKEKVKEIDMFNYLVQTKIPLSNITYYEYFTDQADKDLAVGIEAPKIRTDSDYVIIYMGIRGRSYWEVLKNDLKIVAGLGAVSMVTTGPWTTGRLIGKVASTAFKHPIVVAIVVGSALGTQAVSTIIGNSYVSSKCNEEWEGCYHLILAPMKASEIGAVCNNIESIP
ncbi:MAG: hypothetical protein IB618_03450 [Candidatus Pacearchaeota archaeon]|nr:MAG: hypothetical protein IB618_03450 [Candidatus Pacearchaeota archaeon]